MFLFLHTFALKQMKKRITIKDIAKELNVHHSTVSRALRNNPNINQKTKDLVTKFACENGYLTNMNAIQLRENVNNTIALIVPNINHNFFSNIVSHLTNLAYQKGYIISVFQTNERYIQERTIIDTIIKHNFAGVIASIAKDTVNSDHFLKLNKFGMPLVFFDRVCEDISTPKVLVNNYEIIFSATEFLIHNGFDRIVHVTGTNNINVFRDRQNGYIDALIKNNMNYQNAIVVSEIFTPEIGASIMKNLWSLKEKPNAIISSSIHLTVGFLAQSRLFKLNTPNDFGIITCGSQLSIETQQPSIISIEQPEIEIAEISFELLRKMMTQELEPGLNIIREVKAKIVFGDSC